MLQPHSLFWHYLWVAPNLLSAVLATILWKRGLHRGLRSFCIYAWFQAIQWAILYPMDLIPSVSAEVFWWAYWVSLVVESIIVFVLISDIFAGVFGSYTALAHFGKQLIRWAAALLIVAATAIAAYAPMDNTSWLIPASHMLQEGMYIVISGLMLLLFGASAFFRLEWPHRVFGIALGMGISACVHLATWTVAANGGLMDKRYLLDIINMATSHIAVLIWFYYLLVPQKVVVKSSVPLPESNLDVWNRELERLIHQ